MRVILADTQVLVRAGIRRLIEAIGDIEVVAETADGQQLLDLAARLRPDLVVTELTLAGMSGLDVVAQLRRHYPEIEVLILSGQTGAQQVRAVVKSGVSGFLCKDAELAELELALRAAARGQNYLSPQVSRIALDQRRHRRAEDRPVLTARQRQVMQLIARGRSTKEIAAIMGVSVKTVETHRARLMQALGVRGTNALMHYAIRHGFDTLAS
ncbi:MAG: response regulator transcription factor [Nevskiaceae bacterium]|nr:MAG: response regulator transcription factor [Nevskiaceae bacterium]